MPRLGKIRVQVRLLLLLIVVSLQAVLVGCTGMPSRMSDEERTRHLTEAEIKANELVAAGKYEQAIGILTKAANMHPGRKEPWVNMAKLYFGNAQYGEAIVASEEVLQRDPADSTAKSVRAVSGLRVATESLWDLREDAETTGSARDDAKNLAKVLRETLGEEVLVPPVDQERLRKQRMAEEAAVKRARRRARAARRAAREAAKAKIQAEATTAVEDAIGDKAPALDGDPFNVLR